MSSLRLVLAALVALAFALPPAGVANAQSTTDGVYRIFTVADFPANPQQGQQRNPQQGNRTVGTGTGFLVSGRRMVVTNNHVVSLTRQVNGQTVQPTQINFLIGIIRNGQPVLIRARLVNTTAERDLALLEASEDLPGRAFTIADYDPKRDIDVEAIGFPAIADVAFDVQAGAMRDLSVGQLEPIKTQGRVQRIFDLTRAIISGRPLTAHVIQHTAVISGGNSGGPLFNRCGQVIGVNTFTAQNSQAVAAAFHAVSSREVARFLREQNVTISVASGFCLLPGAYSDYVTLPNFFGLAALALGLAALVIAKQRPQVIQQTVSRVQSGFSRLNRGPPGSPPAHGGGGGTPFGDHQPTRAPLRDAGPPGRASNGERRAITPAGPVVRLAPIGGGAALEIATNRLTQGQSIIVGRSLELMQEQDPHDHPLIVADKTVSRRHARLTLDSGNRLRIEDLGSTSGTFKGDTRVQQALFSSGDEVRFGAAAFRITVPGS